MIISEIVCGGKRLWKFKGESDRPIRIIGIIDSLSSIKSHPRLGGGKEKCGFSSAASVY